nr:L-type lectin-domain containing receptor kinase IV.1-like [Ipomoea batatas]
MCLNNAVTWAVVISAILLRFAASEDIGFTYNGFRSANLSLDGIAEVTSNGLLRLTNDTQLQKGRALYPLPINFKNSPNGSAFSFSTTFVFAIVPAYSILAGHGMTFAISPAGGLPGAFPSPFLGLFNQTNTGNATNHVVAVEIDTLQNHEFNDIDGNHVGIDINGLNSVVSEPAGYYESNFFRNLSLVSGKPTQVWVEYDGRAKKMNVTIAPLNIGKPNRPILSLSIDISKDLYETVSIGFTAATGAVVSTHYLLGWSFKINGIAQPLDISRLPKLPRIGPKRKPRILVIGVPLISMILLAAIVSAVAYCILRKKKFSELLEDWEVEYRPQRFKYKELYIATKGFSDKEVLGSGGFGKVYRGVLPKSTSEIAVKKVSHQSIQGMRAFIAEVVSMGRLCHRNLVPLLGYCRRKGELFLVYEYMLNGSLDKYLYRQPNWSLGWNQRFGVIKGVASALLYLHEEWEQVVVHRDVKASNVLLDSEMNARLGDFGLARLYDHGTDPQTTHVVGTLGYLAPEHVKTGKATTSTDVFAFGAFLLEVTCGRRPIEPQAPNDNVVLVEWVFSWWNRGEILRVVDPTLGEDYVVEEVELVLKLGLMCSLLEPTFRPSMRQVVMYLEGSIAPPELSSLSLSTAGLTIAHGQGFDDFVVSLSSSSGIKTCSRCSLSTDSILSGGR